MQEQSVQIGKTNEHVLVCLSPAPSNKRIIDAAAKMAAAFGASFTAIYVQRYENDSLSGEDLSRLQSNIRVAEDYGATITRVIGDNIPYQIAEFARISGVTKIVIGRDNTRRSHFWRGPSLTEQLITIAPNIDVYIIPDSYTKIKTDNRKRIVRDIIPTWKDILLTIWLLFFATVLGLLFGRLGFTEANIITVYILGVLINSIITKSHVCSFIGSIGSVLLFNFFFTEPKLTFHAYEPGYYVTFIIMLAAALITGTLATRLKDNAKQSAQAAYRTKVLFDTNQLVQKARSEDEVIRIIANQVLLLLDRDVVFYPVQEDELGIGFIFTGETKDDAEFFFEDYERETAEWVLRNKKRAGASTKYRSDAKALYLAVRIMDSVYGVMGIHIAKKPLDSFDYSILLSILGECALALENLKNERDKEQAKLMAQEEKLRSNLLRTISHDLRTPLTSISGNASNLCNHYEQLEKETLKQVFSDIYDDAEWLINLVENLLSVTRIENGKMQLNTSIEFVDDVIDEAIKHLDRNSKEHNIQVRNAEKMLFAVMDSKLIVQVIINLINNAIKYSQKNSNIIIEAGEANDKVYIQVMDDGPGMSDSRKEHAFDMFYTGQNKVADSKRSLGLGLALCKAIVEAHGGTITIEDNAPTGCKVTFYLEKGDVTISE